MQRAPLALGALGLLDLALLVGARRLELSLSHESPSTKLLVGALVIIAVAGSAARAFPTPVRSVNYVDATGLALVVSAVVLPPDHLAALCLGIALVGHRSLSKVRRLGNTLVELAAVLIASVAFRVVDTAIGSQIGTSAGCLVAGLTMCLVTAILASLLSRFVDGVPFRQQPIWYPQHYARAQAFDLLGSLAAFLLLVSPWSLLFLGAPQLLLAGLLLKDAGSSAAAEQDAKTGLLNHPALVAGARAELGRAARHGDPVSLLVLDLDHLREINNRHGHPVGDLAIAAVADVLRRSVRAHDLAARVGGEEFLVLLPATDLEGALDAAERIRRSLADSPIPARAEEVRVTASVGVAQVEPGEPWESLYDRADQALLSAKRAGRDRVEPAHAMALE
ncbi:MAG: GGDEF domain-containing protein [Motilibacteraceae bacterium]